jgi:hypothetical protein
MMFLYNEGMITMRMKHKRCFGKDVQSTKQDHR